MVQPSPPQTQVSGWAGMFCWLPVRFTGTMGTLETNGPESSTGAPWFGWEHHPSWGACFGEQHIVIAAHAVLLGWDCAGAAADGAAGALIMLLLIEDHLHLVI